MDNQDLDLAFVKMVQNRNHVLKNQKQNKELEDNYVRNASKVVEFGKKEIPKSKMSQKQVNFRRKLIGTIGLVVMGTTAIMHYESKKVITRHVCETGIIPKNVSVRNDSRVGYLFTVVDEFGHAENISGEYFINSIVNEAEMLDMNVDDVAIALDYMGYCDAGTIEDSSFLGRFGQELKVVSGLYDLEGKYEMNAQKRSGL